MKQSIRRAANAKKKSAARWAAVAACMVCVIGFSQTAYAKEAINGILQTISLGHSNVMQVDFSKVDFISKDSGPVQYYDKNGNPIVDDGTPADFYDANGQLICSTKRPDSIVENDLSKAASKINFTPIVPDNMPYGFKFDHATLCPDKNGIAIPDWINLFYKNDEMTVRVTEYRLASKNADEPYYMTVHPIEKVNINGHDAALTPSDGFIFWEANGVGMSIERDHPMMFTGPRKLLSREELISLAKAFQ
jgi:hypothetical protein